MADWLCFSLGQGLTSLLVGSRRAVGEVKPQGKDLSERPKRKTREAGLEDFLPARILNNKTWQERTYGGLLQNLTGGQVANPKGGSCIQSAWKGKAFKQTSREITEPLMGIYMVFGMWSGRVTSFKQQKQYTFEDSSITIHKWLLIVRNNRSTNLHIYYTSSIKITFEICSN